MENRMCHAVLLVFLLLATLCLPEPGSATPPHHRQHPRPPTEQSGEHRRRDRPSPPGNPGKLRHPPPTHGKKIGPRPPGNRHPGRKPTHQRPFHRRPPQTIPRQWDVPWYDLNSGAESSRSQYEELVEKASSLAARVRALDEKYRAQHLFLNQARTYAQEMRANRGNPDFIFPDEVVVFLLDHDMMLPSPNQDGVYGPAEFAGMRSLLEEAMSRLRREIDTTVLQRDDALRQYNATIDILLRRYQRIPLT